MTPSSSTYDMDHSEAYSNVFTKEELRDLQQRSDLPAVLRSLIQFSLLIASATLIVFAANWSWIVLTPAILLCGLLIASMHAPLHECTHRTAFKSMWANNLVGWLAGFPMLMTPSFYRDFHFEHHRHTHDPQRDPEINAAGEKFAAWPECLHEYLLMASGVVLLFARLVGLPLLALSSRGPWWDKLFPYIRAQNRRQVTHEARVYLSILLCLVACGMLILPELVYLTLAMLVGFAILAVYLASEHTGLATTGSIFDRSRTTYTSAIVRYFMWNMPYHAEHHAYPAVPFHALPKLHARVKPALKNTSEGYVHLQARVISGLKILPPRRDALSKSAISK